jgi:hypothetical protein
MKKAKEERERREKEKQKIRAIVSQRLDRDKLILQAFEALVAPKRKPKIFLPVFGSFMFHVGAV